MTVIQNGPMSMSRPLVQWFIFVVVVSVLTAYLAGATLPADAPYLAVFRVAGTTAFIAYAAGVWPQSIWYHRPWSTTLKFTLDGLIYGLLTGGASAGYGRSADNRRAMIFFRIKRRGPGPSAATSSSLLGHVLPGGGAARRRAGLRRGGRDRTATRVLVDVRGINGRVPTILDRFEFGVHIARNYLRVRRRGSASPCSGHEPMIHPERFGELVARNRGADARVFTDEARGARLAAGAPGRAVILHCDKRAAWAPDTLDSTGLCGGQG